jgi:transcription elongation factor GreB
MNAKVYITPDGAHSLRVELNHLYREKRPEITRIVAAAAALGDRSENADYIYGKKQLREIDKRIRYLTKRLDALEIVDRKPDDRDRVFFGAWIRLEDDEGSISEVRIVGADEFDLSKGWISLDSPMSRSLLGKRVGDDVIVHRPVGDLEVSILKVSYEPF